MSLLRFVFLFGLCVSLSGWPLPAKAAFLFCNQTKSVIEAAFGHHDQGQWVSAGWWQLQQGQCARVYNNPLTQRFYFYYAHALTAPAAQDAPPTVWSGKYPFCTDKKAFRIQGDSKCVERGYQVSGFQEVDVGPNQRDYTLTFRDSSAP